MRTHRLACRGCHRRGSRCAQSPSAARPYIRGNPLADPPGGEVAVDVGLSLAVIREPGLDRLVRLAAHDHPGATPTIYEVDRLWIHTAVDVGIGGGRLGMQDQH